MVNSILNAITKQLGTTFGNTHHYYVEDVEQGLTTPCFTVDTLQPLERSRSSIQYDRTVPIVIHYFPSTVGKKSCYTMAEQIIECLEYLPYTATTKIRGENISWHMVEDILQVFITYRFTSQKVVTPDDNMETLSTDVSHS